MRFEGVTYSEFSDEVQHALKVNPPSHAWFLNLIGIATDLGRDLALHVLCEQDVSVDIPAEFSDFSVVMNSVLDDHPRLDGYFVLSECATIAELPGAVEHSSLDVSRACFVAIVSFVSMVDAYLVDWLDERPTLEPGPGSWGHPLMAAVRDGIMNDALVCLGSTAGDNVSWRAQFEKRLAVERSAIGLSSSRV